MHRQHPHLAEIHLHLIKMYQRLAKILCTKQLPGFGVTSKVEQQEGNIEAQYYNCVLTADGKSGITPVWFVIYQYQNATAEFKAQAKQEVIGPKAMQVVNAKPMADVCRQLIEFEKLHKHSRYNDPQGRQSARVGDAIQVIRQTLLGLDTLCTGQVFEMNPDTEEPSDEIVMVDLFLRDPADVDPEGLFKSKVKLVVASPEFIERSLM